ncbi:MAG: cysteine desulfurase family protein [Thermodesulfovibrionales bacterium]
MIYLDNNASTPLDPEVIEEICSALRFYGNPSSSHKTGQHARSLIEKARKKVADVVNASEEEIVFTSGGTESNNLSILGTAFLRGKGHIITSVIEHPSVINPCRFLQEKGFSVSYVGVKRDGTINLEELKRAIREDTILISIMHANNETGIIQPIKEIGLIAREKGITFHTDAAQTVGKIPVDVEKLNVDLLTIVSHKFHGPKGIGALYIKKGLRIQPILFGAGHERGLRPGTENLPGIADIGKACELAKEYVKKRASYLKGLTETLYRELKDLIPDVSLNGDPELRLPNTLNLCLKGIPSTDLVNILSDSVAISTGSACHAGVKRPSSVLLAMGLTEEEALSSIRISLGKDNTEEEVKEAAALIAKAAQGLKGL